MTTLRNGVGYPDGTRVATAVTTALVDATNVTIKTTVHYGPFFVSSFNSVAVRVTPGAYADGYTFTLGWFATKNLVQPLGSLTWHSGSGYRIIDGKANFGPYLRVTISGNPFYSGLIQRVGVVACNSAPNDLRFHTGGFVSTGSAISVPGNSTVTNGPVYVTTGLVTFAARSTAVTWQAQVFARTAGTGVFYLAEIDSNTTVFSHQCTLRLPGIPVVVKLINGTAIAKLFTYSLVAA